MDDITTLLGCATDDPRIEELAELLAEIPELEEDEDRQSLNFVERGVMLVFDRNRRLAVIFLQPGAGSPPLPRGLRFEMARGAVRTLMGEPSLSKPTTEGAFGIPGWDRYDNEAYSLHLQYRTDETGIGVITVMPPQVARTAPVDPAL